MKMPCLENSGFGTVSARPSRPPSLIVSWLISTTARLASLTAPGTTALADVLAVHVEPIAVLAVAVQPRDHGERKVDHRCRVGPAPGRDAFSGR